MPRVTATTALAGLRPVAKALACGSSMKKTRGFGRPARVASSSTTAWRRGASSRGSSRAPFMRSTSLSEKK